MNPNLESTEKPAARDSNQNDAASSSQVWQKRCRKGREYEETRCNRNKPGSSELSSKFREYEGRLVALMAENSESIDGNDTVWPHNFHISAAYVPHLEKVFSNVRQKFCRKPRDNMADLDVKYVDMEIIYESHSSSRSSSWKRLCG